MFRRRLNLVERKVQNWILFPALIVEVPPLFGINGEALFLHGGSEQVTTSPWFGRAVTVVRVGSLRHFIVDTGHLDLMTRFEIVERKIYSATAIVLGAFGRIGHELPLLRRRHVPEDFGHTPGTITIKDQKAISPFLQ